MTNPTPPEDGSPGSDVESEGSDPAGGLDSPPETFHEEPVWKKFYAFLLGPALLAAAALAVFTAMSLLTADDTSPEQLVRALEEGGEHRRWQAAFALTKYLQPSVQSQDTVLLRESDAEYREKLERVRLQIPKLLDIWNDPERGDPKVRKFLALTFLYLGDPQLIPVLREVLDDENVELVQYALFSIATTLDVAGRTGAKATGELTDPQTRAALMTASRRKESDIRATALYALSLDPTPEVTARLREGLEDPAPDVAWNAAFGLARQGDAGGVDIIAEILDRGPLFRAAGPDPGRQRDLFLNAVQSAGMVRSPKLDQRLERIAESEPDPKARNEAMKLLEKKKADSDEG